MSGELTALALGANRVLLYAGYVLLAGTFSFWGLVWPEGRSSRRLVGLSVLGTALLVVSTLAGPAIGIVLGHQLPGDVLTASSGAATMVRLAALAATAFFVVDLVRRPVVGWRRVFALGIVVVLAATMVAQSSAVGGRWELVEIALAGGHVLGTAVWLGGLVALAAVILPRANPPELDQLVPRFSGVATGSLIVLAVTGVVHAIALAGGISPLASSGYGLVLLAKVVILVTMLVLGGYGRRYAARLAFRRQHHPADTLGSGTDGNAGVRGLAWVVGAELVVAFLILSTTSVLVALTPH